MSRERLRDFALSKLGDDDDTPADSASHRAMGIIARRTRFVLFFMLGLCAASFATSASLFVYQFTVLRERREVSREIQLGILRHLERLDPDGPDAGVHVSQFEPPPRS